MKLPATCNHAKDSDAKSLWFVPLEVRLRVGRIARFDFHSRTLDTLALVHVRRALHPCLDVALVHRGQVGIRIEWHLCQFHLCLLLPLLHNDLACYDSAEMVSALLQSEEMSPKWANPQCRPQPCSPTLSKIPCPAVAR